MMFSTPTGQSSLIKDPFTLLCEQNPFVLGSYLQLSQNMRTIALNRFLSADKTLMKAIPALLPEENSNSITVANALPLFKRLVNRLHEEAEALDCDLSPETYLSPQERMAWECDHYPQLLQEVQERMKIAEIEDFNTFVKAVAENLEKKIPKKMTLREFWNKTLKIDKKTSKITTLNLFQKGLRFLPPEISSLSNVESLYLGSNQFREVPAKLTTLSKLKRLDMSGNQVHRIAEDLPFPLSLEHLKFNGNKLRKLPRAFTSLQRLKYLDISENPLGKLPPVLSSLSNLTSLYLNSTQIVEVPQDLTLPPNLRELYLTSNRLKEISGQAIASLSHLRKLFMYHNPLNGATKDRLSALLRTIPGIDIKWNQPLQQHTWGE